MTEHRFEAKIQSNDRGGHLVEVPLDVPALFGEKRAPVIATVNGHPYGTRIAVYGGRYYIGLNREVRDVAKVGAGDVVEITLAHDDQPREVEMPPDLAIALKGSPEARTTFNALSFTHRKEYVRWITEAKKQETRDRRVAKAIEMLAEGTKTPG